MRITDRRRLRRGSGQQPEAQEDAAPEPTVAQAVREDDVIRASSLNRVPDWATIPPIAPTLPEMPVVVSRHFDDSLASWQPPERFIAPLAHSVSPDAPTGVVEGLAHLTAIPVDPSAMSPAELPVHPTDQPELVLAVPAPPGGDDRRPVTTSRRVDRLFESAESATPSVAGPEPVTSAVADPVEPGTDTPSGVTVRPVEPSGDTTPATVPNPLLYARTPPDMPLPRLAATQRVPGQESGSTDLSSGGEPASPVAMPVADGESDTASTLVGQREIDVSVRRDPLGVTAQPTEEASGEGPVEMPLASAANAVGSAQPDEMAGRAGYARATPDPVPVSPESEPGVPGPVDVATPQPDTGSVPPVDSYAEADSTLTGASANPQGGDPQAPLLGDIPPLVREIPTPTSVAEPVDAPAPVLGRPDETPLATPTTRRRAGIGEPMSGLPSTSASWDVTALTPAQQRQTSRALIQSQMARSAKSAQRSPDGPETTRPSSPERSPVFVATEETVFAGTELPLVGIKRAGPTMEGTVPADIAPATRDEVPILSPSRFSAVRAAEVPASESSDTDEGRRARSVVGSRYGMDMSAVPVDRNPQAASAAQNMRAKAFTSQHAVVIPDSAGTLESGPGEALLAHELTHVAQRARFGAGLPAESTPAGRVLEAEALAVEMTFPGASHRAAPLLRPEQPTSGVASRSIAAAPESSAELPLAPSTPSALDPDVLAATLIERMSTVTSPGSPGRTETFTASWPPASIPAPSPAAAVIQRAEDTTALLPAPVPQGSPPDQAPAGSLTRPSDEELTKLSQWLYPLLKYRLKGELREDRERAGLLTDHYRRW